MKLTLRQAGFILFLLLTPLFLSLLPFFIQSYLSPGDRVFMGLHRWSEDYYGYLQSINQGLMGHLTNVSKLTLIQHQPTFAHSEYVLLGLVGRFFGLNSILTYHLSRLVLGAIFVSVAFYFFNYLFSRMYVAYDDRRFQHTYPLIAFFLAFFVGGFPFISFTSSSSFPFLISHFSLPLPWWTELDVLTRSTILPHYLMGNIFFLLIIILFLKLTHPVILGNPPAGGRLQNPNKADSGQARMTPRYLFLVSLFSFLLAFVHPIDFLILLFSLGTFVVFQIILNFFFRFKISLIRQIGLIIVIFVSGLIPALYYRYALSLPFWRFILAHGTTTSYNIPLFDLSLALGPTFFITILGIFLTSFNYIKVISLHVIKTINPNRIIKDGWRAAGSPTRGPLVGNAWGWRETGPVFLLLFSWLFVQALFFLKLYEVFNFDRLRTMQAPFYLPLAFFATYLIMSLRGNIPHIVLILLIFLATLPTTIINLKNQIFSVSNFKTFSLFSYPTARQYQAWQFLRYNTPDNSAITALYEAKFLIPAVSGNKIAFGANFDNDPKYQENLNLISQIYQTSLNSQITEEFLKKNRISLLYQGYQEQSLGGNLSKYSFLQKIFANGEVTIFKVK